MRDVYLMHAINGARRHEFDNRPTPGVLCADDNNVDIFSTYLFYPVEFTREILKYYRNDTSAPLS